MAKQHHVALIPLSQLTEAIDAGDSLGFCLRCGEMAAGVEPDARRYECESCGARAVYGAEEILLIGGYDEHQ